MINGFNRSIVGQQSVRAAFPHCSRARSGQNRPEGVSPRQFSTKTCATPEKSCSLMKPLGSNKVSIEKMIGFKGPEYEQQTAQEKQSQLFSEIQSSVYKERPQWNGFEVLNLLGRALSPFRALQKKHMDVTMEFQSDVMPAGRLKGIHTYGSVAKVKFVPAPNTPYSGLFKGSQSGLMRLSLATKPTDENSVPGLAVKMLVDGKSSRNFVAMHSLEGQKGHDFFKNSFCTTVSEPRAVPLQLLANLFKLAAKNPFASNVNYLSEVTEKGVTESQAKGPESLMFVAAPQIKSKFSDSLHDVRDDFADIPAGSALYQVFDQDSAFVGEFVTESPFIASKFGDERLFFRHERG